MNPLEKLRAALEEYLASGDNTPVAAEAQALMDSIQSSDPTSGDQGGLPPTPDPMGGAPDPGAPNPYQPDAGGASLADMPPPQPNAKTFEGARAGAKDRLKKLNKR